MSGGSRRSTSAAAAWRSPVGRQPGNNARSLPPQAGPLVECQIELGIEEIRPYEHNPRRSRNAKFEDIKESILAGGLRAARSP